MTKNKEEYIMTIRSKMLVGLLVSLSGISNQLETHK